MALQEFSKNLQRAMKHNGISQKALAEKLNTTQQTVSRWYLGINEPDFSTLLRICEILDETPNRLLGVQ